MAHCTTVEYEFRGSVDSLFWTSPLTQYHALNFLIVQSCFLFHFKAILLEARCYQQLTSLKQSLIFTLS